LKAGWLPEASVASLVLDHLREIASLPYILISSVDSHLNVKDMAWAREQLRIDPGLAASITPFVVSGTAFVRLVRGPLSLNGFDEIWIPTTLPIGSPPNEASLVAPRRLNQFIPTAVADWMLDAGVRGGLGDGDGLNFVFSDAKLARDLGCLATG
jgi:hypothetical protein